LFISTPDLLPSPAFETSALANFPYMLNSNKTHLTSLKYIANNNGRDENIKKVDETGLIRSP